MKKTTKQNKKADATIKMDASFCKKNEKGTTVKLGPAALPIVIDCITNAVRDSILLEYCRKKEIYKKVFTRDIRLSLTLCEREVDDISKMISSHTDNEGLKLASDLKNLPKTKEELGEAVITLSQIKEELSFYKSRNLWQRIINKHQ